MRRGPCSSAAIEGEIFHLGAVQALAPEETQVTPRLAALVRKEVIRPDTPLLEAQDGFRFRHILIRDAAYEAMPKATRAELHERFAAWLAEHGTELAELDEILGYHLELACDYLGELGTARTMERWQRRRDGTWRRAATARTPGRTTTRRRGARSSERRRSMPADEVDLVLEIELGEALVLDRKGRRGACGAPTSSPSGPPRPAIGLGSSARESGQPSYASTSNRRARWSELDPLLREALPVFEDAGDDLALFIGYSAQSGSAGGTGGRGCGPGSIRARLRTRRSGWVRVPKLARSRRLPSLRRIHAGVGPARVAR